MSNMKVDRTEEPTTVGDFLAQNGYVPYPYGHDPIVQAELSHGFTFRQLRLGKAAIEVVVGNTPNQP